MLLYQFGKQGLPFFACEKKIYQRNKGDVKERVDIDEVGPVAFLNDNCLHGCCFVDVFTYLSNSTVEHYAIISMYSTLNHG